MRATKPATKPASAASVVDEVEANALALSRLAKLAEARQSQSGLAACDELAPLIFATPRGGQT